MTPGELDQLISIQRETRVPDGMGGVDIEIVDVAKNLWAKARALSGTEALRHDQVTAMALVRFIIRNRDDLRDDDRIVWNGTEYNIRFIQPTSGRNLYLMIDAEKGVAM